MALSLLYNPGEYFSAHEDLLFTIFEDTKPFSSSTYPDYKYVCDVYIGAVLVARLKAFPRPDDKIGVFNIGNIVRNYLAMTLAPAAANLRAQKIGADAFYVNVICRFGEEYGTVTYSNLIIDSQRTYYNHYNGRMIGALTNLADYQDKAMTVRPYATPVYRASKFVFIPFLPTDDTTINLVIKSYNGNGLIATTTQPFTPTASSTNEQQLFNVSPTAINAASPGFISDYIDYYTVQFSTTNITDDSIYRFNLVCEAIHDVYTLHFLNRFGGFESKSFTKVSRSSIAIEKSDYGSAAYSISSLGQPEYYSSTKVYKETISTYAAGWKEKMTLNTDLLPDAEYTWLRDLVMSPLVYLEQDDYFLPAKVTATDYEFKKTVNDDLTNLTLSIEFGDKFNTQYR